MFMTFRPIDNFKAYFIVVLFRILFFSPPITAD